MALIRYIVRRCRSTAFRSRVRVPSISALPHVRDTPIAAVLLLIARLVSAHLACRLSNLRREVCFVVDRKRPLQPRTAGSHRRATPPGWSPRRSHARGHSGFASIESLVLLCEFNASTLIGCRDCSLDNCQQRDVLFHSVKRRTLHLARHGVSQLNIYDK